MNSTCTFVKPSARLRLDRIIEALVVPMTRQQIEAALYMSNASQHMKHLLETKRVQIVGTTGHSNRTLIYARGGNLGAP